MGDMNSKLGKVSLSESTDTNVYEHVGRYAVGTRNSNGEQLLNFLYKYDLFACNTAFPHKCRHMTTWTGYLKDHSRPGHHTYPVHTQIDYIMCKTRSKGVLQNARAYAGASLISDHKIVMARLDLDKPYLTHLRRPAKTVYNISSLTTNHSVQAAYRKSLDSCIEKTDFNDSASPAKKLDCLLHAVTSTAADVVGTVKPSQRVDSCNDSVIKELVNKRKQLRSQLNTNISCDRSPLRTEINSTQKRIQKHLAEKKDKSADDLIA